MRTATGQKGGGQEGNPTGKGKVAVTKEHEQLSGWGRQGIRKRERIGKGGGEEEVKGNKDLGEREGGGRR